MPKKMGLAPAHDEHINVTPLIDVVMCLIIFFMVCGRLAAGEGDNKVLVPKADNGQELAEQRGRLIINLVPNPPPDVPKENEREARSRSVPKVVIRGEEVPFPQLTEYLRRAKKEDPELRLLIRGDRDLQYEHISPVLVSCAQADIKSLHFATELP